MIDVKVIDEARFAKEYAPGHAPALKAAGAFPEVVCSGDITCLRGQAKPNFIVLHAWASSAAFRTFYDGGKYTGGGGGLGGGDVVKDQT